MCIIADNNRATHRDDWWGVRRHSSVSFWFRNEFPVVLVGFHSRHVHHRRRVDRRKKTFFTSRFHSYSRVFKTISEYNNMISKTNFIETLILFLLAPIPDDNRPTSFSQGHSLHFRSIRSFNRPREWHRRTRDGSILLLSLYPSFPFLSSHVSLNIDL